MSVVVTGSMIMVELGTELSKMSIGRDTVIGIGVPVGVAVAVAVGVGVRLAVGVGEGVGGTPVMVMRPLVRLGLCCPKSASKKKKLFGGGRQTNGLIAPGVLLTLSILRLKSVPDPFSGVSSSERANTCRVLSVPGPVLRIVEEMVQLVAVSPASCACGVAKVTTAESKVKSASKPT